MKLKQLEQRHPQYDERLLLRNGDLYEGGAAFRSRIDSYLPKAHMEDASVYRERCLRAVYENHVAPILDQWVGETFGVRPRFDSGGVPLSDETTAFLSNCDRRGTDLIAFWRERLTRALIDRCAYALIDRPERPAELEVRDRGDARALGLTQAYLCPLNALQIIDWDEDDSGSLARVMVRTERSVRTGPESPRQLERTWTWYDAEGWRRWRTVINPDRPLKEDDDVPEAGNGLNLLGRLPIVRLELPPGLWLANLLAEPALGLFNTDNALDWSLYRSAFATLVIQHDWIGDNNASVDLAPGGWLKLEPGDKYGFIEPGGVGFEALDARGRRKLEGIYRITRQMALSVANDSTRARASGEAKNADRVPTKILLGFFGRLVREALQSCLDLVGELHSETPVRVEGMEEADYEDVDLEADLNNAVLALSLRVPSATFLREVKTRVADRMTPDLDPDQRTQMHAEIDAGIPDQMQADDVFNPVPGESAR